MGPGGLRGLQILRSGASSVRGGFDSHAFPPLLVLVVLAALGLTWGAAGATAGSPAGVAALAVDSVGPGADSTEEAEPEVPGEAAADSAAGVTPADSARTHGPRVSGARVARPAEPVSYWDRPKWVMLRSLVLPGWGQMHNHAWIKATGVIAAEGGLALKLVDDRRNLDDLSAQVDAARAAGDDLREALLVDQYNALLAKYTQRQWLLGGVVAFALLDAYIDAHFRDFHVEFEDDPALPGGAPPSKSLRMSLRWGF